MSADRMGFVGYRPCGCRVAAIMDMAHAPEAVLDAVRDMAKRGDQIEYVPVESVGPIFAKCPRHVDAEAPVSADQPIREGGEP